MNAVLGAAVLVAALAASAAGLPTDASALGSGRHRTRDRRDTGIYIGPGSFSANVNVNNSASLLPATAEPAASSADHHHHQKHQPAGSKVSQVYGVHIGESNFSPTVNAQKIASPSALVPDVTVHLSNANSPAITTESETPNSSQSQPDREKNQPVESSGPVVYGVNIGDRNFSPTVNAQKIASPLEFVPKVTVNLSNANSPTIASDSETSKASQSQPDCEQSEPEDRSGPVVYGVNIGDGNFSPNINVPSMGSPSVNVPRITSHPVSESLFNLPNFG